MIYILLGLALLGAVINIIMMVKSIAQYRATDPLYDYYRQVTMLYIGDYGQEVDLSEDVYSVDDHDFIDISLWEN